MTADLANSYLKRDRRSYDDNENDVNQGIVCECCVHRCSFDEITQYCEAKRKRRSVRSVITGVTETEPTSINPFNEEGLAQVYQQIEQESRLPIDAKPIFTEEEYEKILILEKNKQKNIEKKHYIKEVEKKNSEPLAVMAIKVSTTTAKLTDNAIVYDYETAATTKPLRRRRHQNSKRSRKRLQTRRS